MAKTTNNPYIDKTIKDGVKYIGGRLKVIVIAIILLLIAKNPAWDVVFIIVIILQFGMGLFYVVSIPKKIQEAEQKYKSEQRRKYNENFYKEYWFKGHREQQQRQQQQKRHQFIKTDVNKITTSAKLLDINIIQDDESTIKKKFRKMAMKWHPDKFANDTAENQEIAKRNFQKANAAYEVVKEYKKIK